MWYKIKRILTWVNWEEKQIYPAGWTYSYDFQWKTKSQIFSDGWETQQWIINCDSDWLYCTNWRISIPMPWNYDKAKKIKFEYVGILWNSWTQDVATCTTSVKTWEQNYILNYNTYSPNSSTFGVWWTGNNYIVTVPNTTYAWNMVVDIINKTCTITFTQWISYTNTINITDSQITNIKTNKYISIFMNWSYPRTKSIKLTVEV